MTTVGWIAITFFLGVGVLVSSVVMTTYGKANASKGDPPAAVTGGPTDMGTQAADYFTKNPSACASVELPDDVRARYPDLPYVLAALKFTLAQKEWLARPALKRNTTKFNYTRPSFTDRAAIIAILNDPSFIFSSPATINPAAAANTVSANEIELHRAGADSSIKKAPDTPYGLAFNILHELAHVQQIREGRAKPGQSSGAVEVEANSYSLHLPQSLFAGDAWEAFKKANPCKGGTQKPNASGPVSGSVILILDASGSMDEKLPGSDTRKIDAAKSATKKFLEGNIPASVEVGLIVYYDCGDIRWSKFTRDPKSLVSVVEAASPSGSTPLGKSIDEAAAHMKNDAAKNGQPGDIIVVSDGQETCAGKPTDSAKGASGVTTGTQKSNERPAAPGEPILAVVTPMQAGSQEGTVRVSTIGLQVGGTAADTQLRDIAAAGNGVYAPADDQAALQQALQGAVRAKDPEVPQVLDADSLQPAPGGSIWLIVVAVVAFVAGGAGIVLVYRWDTARAGAPVAAAAPIAPPAGTPAPGVCRSCGTPLRPGQRFCGRCGSQS